VKKNILTQQYLCKETYDKKGVVCMDYFALGILAISLFLAALGLRLMVKARKNHPESTKKIAKELFVGIIGGSIVALAVLAGESPPILIPVVGFDILLMGLAFALGAE
jgi:predicted membrane-bound spermidine synthase